MVFQNNILSGVGGQGGAEAYTIDYSCRFNRDATARLTRTVSGTPTDPSKGIIGGWFKKAGNGITQTLWDAPSQGFLIDFSSGDLLQTTDDGSAVYHTTQVFRDPNAWFHLVFSFDSDQTVVGDRWLTYLNGELITDFSSYVFSRITLAEAWLYTEDTGSVSMGSSENDLRWWDGYMSQCFLVDGLSIQNGDYSIASFGEFNNNVWRPIAVTGLTFGTNGYLLDRYTYYELLHLE